MINVVYIMGHGFSGSTLLTFLLGSHPEIATVGEVMIAPRAKDQPEALICSCKSPYRDCMFWRRVSAEMGKRGIPFDISDSELDFRARNGGLADVILRAVQRGPLLERARRIGLQIVPQARRELRRILLRNEAFVEVVTGTKRCTTFVDSSKRPERAVYLRRIPSFDIKVIHLIRDGRAVSWSAMKHWSLRPEEAADSWLADNLASEAARRYFPADRWMTLRHEDVCARPNDVLARIHEFAGVSVRPEVGDFRKEQHIIGNQMRLRSTTEIKLDEQWKTALTPAQIKLIEQRLGATNRRYGYDDLKS